MVLGSSLRTRESIRYGESEGKTFQEIIDAATIYGWHSFDHCLLRAFRARDVAEETALLYCTDKGKMRRQLDLHRKLSGQSELETASELKLDIPLSPMVAPESPTESIEEDDRSESSKPTPASNRRVIQPRAPVTTE